MHLSENICTFVNTVCDIYSHWIIIHVWSEIHKFVLVLLHYHLNVIIELFIDTQERSCEILPRKNVFFWHLWIVLVSFFLEMVASDTFNCEVILSLDIIVFVFGLGSF